MREGEEWGSVRIFGKEKSLIVYVNALERDGTVCPPAIYQAYKI